MDVEIFKIMDEIMEINHQIVSYMIDFAKADMEGTTIKGRKITLRDIEKNKILEMLFRRLQEKYREMEENIIDDTENYTNSIEEAEEIEDEFGLETLKYKQVKSMSISDLETYLESCYGDLHLVTVVDGNGNEIVSSIYKKQQFSNLRNAEYNAQIDTLEDIDTRMMIDKNDERISFQEKSYILDDIAKKRFYKEYAIKQVERYIKDLDEKSYEMTPKKYKKMKEILYEQKYIYIYLYLNSKYNGVLQENDIGKLAIVKRYIDDNALSLILNMTPYEIEEIIKVNMLESKEDFKEIINKRLNIKRKEKRKERKEDSQNKKDDNQSKVEDNEVIEEK